MLHLNWKLTTWTIHDMYKKHINLTQTDRKLAVYQIQRNVFDIGGSSTGSERIGKHLKRQKGEGVENENVCYVKGLQNQWSRGDS